MLASLKRLPVVARVHDLAVCIWAVKFLLEGQVAPGLFLLGWFNFIWVLRVTLRITGLPGWFDWSLPDTWGLVLMTICGVLAFEAFLVWVYWKDTINYIMSHY